MVAVISFSSKSRKKLGLHAEVMNTIDQVYIDLYTLTAIMSNPHKYLVRPFTWFTNRMSFDFVSFYSMFITHFQN